MSGPASIPPSGQASPAGKGGPERSDRERKELRDAAVEFESLLVQQLIKTMRTAQLEEGLFGGGAGSDVYSGWFDRYLAENLAEDSPFGIADMLEAQWSRRLDGLEEINKALAEARAGETYENVIEIGATPGDFDPSTPETPGREIPPQVMEPGADKSKQDHAEQARSRTLSPSSSGGSGHED